ncbi:MAG: response regulator transcription factor [Ktedonobacteraceae bacterium]|jgi:ATP/maltotriose-dependent transcriptional regulator MalT|nr:response regulator transcription factor [Ktedonobacteraceae bacterium]
MATLRFIQAPEQAEKEEDRQRTQEQKIFLALHETKTYAEIAADFNLSTKALSKLVTQKIYPMAGIKTRRDLFQESLLRIPRWHLEALCKEYCFTKKERLTFFLMIRKPQFKRGEIASELHSSDATIRNHMHSIYKKMAIAETGTKHWTMVIFQVYKTWQTAQERSTHERP